MKKIVRVITCKDERNQFASTFSNPIELEDINSLTDNSYSHNSLLAMRKDWNLFTEFCQSKHVRPIPASSTAVRLFLEREAQKRKYATIKRYMVTIGLVHRVLGIADPTATQTIQTLMGRLRLEKKHDATTAKPFTLKYLKLITQRLESSTKLKDKRDLAIYYIMFECMLKRGELKVLSHQDVIGDQYAKQLSVGSATYSLSESASLFLDKWIESKAYATGPLFTAIDKHGATSNSPLDDSSIFRILRNASSKLGLDVQFSGQSLRVGAVENLAKQGKKVREIQQLGRWQSAAMPYHYLGNKAQAEEEKIVFKSIKPWT